LSWPTPEEIEAFFALGATEPVQGRKVLSVSELLGEDSTVWGGRYEDCDIVGPAVVFPEEVTVQLFSVNTSFEEAMWIEEELRFKAGMVRFFRCEFVRVRFFWVTFYGGENVQSFIENSMVNGSEFRV